MINYFEELNKPENQDMTLDEFDAKFGSKYSLHERIWHNIAHYALFIPRKIKDWKYAIKAFIQRVRRGYSDEQIWELNKSVAELLSKMLFQFAKETRGISPMYGAVGYKDEDGNPVPLYGRLEPQPPIQTTYESSGDNLRAFIADARQAAQYLKVYAEGRNGFFNTDPSVLTVGESRDMVDAEFDLESEDLQQAQKALHWLANNLPIMWV